MYFIAFLLFIELYFAATLAPSVISLHNICCDTVAAKVSAAPQNPMTRFSFEVYFTAVLNLGLLVCICFQVFLLCPFWRKKDQKLLHTEGVFTSAFCSCRERSFSQALARHGNPWFVCRVLRNSLHAGLGDNIYPRYAQTSSHNGLQTAPVAIEHLNGAGFAFGDELPLLLKALIRTNDNRGFLFLYNPFTLDCPRNHRDAVILDR